MSCENMFLSTSMVGKIIKFRILVVDDDSTCLHFVAGMLRKFSYQVVTANDPIEAMSTIRKNKGVFDLVLSDVHMPSMSGLELQRRVEEEFNIPVILMTGDKKEKLIKEVSLKKDTYIITKPPQLSELNDIWKFVISPKEDDNSKVEEKGKRKEKENGKEIQHGETSGSQKRKSSNIIEENIEYDQYDKKSKMSKMSWTIPLHEKFLEAINVIGLDRAVPKKILEYMNDPKLTRKHIASHLQKYRLYMKKIQEADLKAQGGIPQNWNQRPFRSGFTWSQFPTLAQNTRFLLNYANALNPSHYQQSNASNSINETTQLGDNNMFFPSGFFESLSCQELDSMIDPSGFANPIMSHGLTHEQIMSNSTTFGAQNNANGVAPLSILESSMLNTPKENNNNQGSVDGDSTNHFDVDVGHVSNVAIPNNSSQPQQVYSNTIIPNMVANSDAQTRVWPQLSGYGGLGNYMGMVNNGGFPFTNNIATSNMMSNNFFMQPQQEASMANMIPYNYSVQIPNASMGNMSNYVAQPQLGNMYNFGGAMNNMQGIFVQPQEPTIGKLNIFNLGAQSQPCRDSNVYNFLEQQPHHVANMPNFIEQQQSHFGNMANFPQQLPTNVVNMPNFVEQPPPTPPPNEIVSNMSTLNNSAGNYQQTMVPPLLNTTSTDATNQEKSLLESNDQESLQGSGYASGSEHSDIQAFETYNAEHIPVDDYAANLFVDDNPHIESNIERPTMYY